MPELNTNLIKTIYFYLVLAGCVLALSIGSYWLIRANLIKYVFPEADDYYYGIDTSRKMGYYDCQMYLGLSYAPAPGEKENPPVLTDEQEKECRNLIEAEKQMQRERKYQNDMLSSILMILISGIVLATHLKWARVR
jgi:hypothetical protein